MLKAVGNLIIALALFALAFAIVIVWAGENPPQPFIGTAIVAGVPFLIGCWLIG